MKQKTKEEPKNVRTKSIKNALEQNPQYGWYTQRIRNIEKTSQCLKSAELKAETEGLIIAARDQNQPTRNYQVNIIKMSKKICRLCEQKAESTDHYVSGLVWFGGFYGISTFVGYLTPKPFLCK